MQPAGSRSKDGAANEEPKPIQLVVPIASDGALQEASRFRHAVTLPAIVEQFGIPEQRACNHQPKDLCHDSGARKSWADFDSDSDGVSWSRPNHPGGSGDSPRDQAHQSTSSAYTGARIVSESFYTSERKNHGEFNDAFFATKCSVKGAPRFGRGKHACTSEARGGALERGEGAKNVPDVNVVQPEQAGDDISAAALQILPESKLSGAKFFKIPKPSRRFWTARAVRDRFLHGIFGVFLGWKIKEAVQVVQAEWCVHAWRCMCF